MAYYKNKGGRKGHTLRVSTIEAAYKDGKYAAPSAEKVTGASLLLQAKAFKELDNMRAGIIDVKADPNAEMSYGSFPYTIIGRTNPVIDAKYPGDNNIAGNSIVQLQNNTTSSQLMNIFDVVCLAKKLNYMYLPITSNDQNIAYAGEMIKAIEQAIAFGFSTMLTQLAFTTDNYESDIPIPSIYKDAETGKPLKSAQFYSALIHYQTILQNLATPITRFITLMSLEKELMRMSFRTEAPMLTEMFGLFKKRSFVAALETISTTILNEYFDKNWYHQMNALTNLPSRKTQGMMDPLTTLVTSHSVPSLKIYASGSEEPYYDSADFSSNVELVDPEDFIIKNQTLDIAGLVHNLSKLLSPAYILKYVRQRNQKSLAKGAISTASAYCDQVKRHLDYLSVYSSSFTTAMSNIRTFIDKLDQSNMIYWTKGNAFFITDKYEQYSPRYNALLSDLIQAEFAGANKMIYDYNTKRWRGWAFWNKYTGIPEYDMVSGGSFLTFSLRNVSTTDSSGNELNFSSSDGLYPALFTNGFTDTLVVSRAAAWFKLSTQEITNEQVQSHSTLSRLNPLNNSTISLKQPVVNISSSTTTKTNRLAAAAKLFIFNTFGFGVVNNEQVLDQDYVCFIDFEVEDVSNEMITLARNYSPFRISTPNPKRTIGFLSM